MAVWQEKRLVEVAEINMGQSPKSIYYNKDNIGTPFLQGNGDFGRIFPIITTYTSSVTKLAHAGDILFSVRAPVGAINIANTAVCIGRGLSSIRSKENYNHIFLRYSLEYLVNEIKKSSNGAIFDSITKNDLYNSRISIPDLATQEKIADILSTYDDLIENNNRRIEILEQMAQEIYKEWFVRFRFPGHEKVKFVSSKLGKLPQTFNVVNAESLFEFYIGGGWGNENISENFPIEANVIRGTDIPNVRKYDISSCPVRYHKISNYKSRQLVNGDIVMEISGGTADQPVGRCALITQELIDRFKNGNVICASFCKLIRLNKNLISPYFCYYWLQYLYDTRIIDRFQLQSTGIINFKFEAFLKKGLIMLPPMNIMLQFENYVKYIVQEINMLASQNQNLIKQRDLLLPRLMSGKLEV